MDFKVKCLESVDSSITKGKIYEVVCGKLIDDSKDKRPFNSDRTIKSVDDINNYETIPYAWLGAFSLVEEEIKKEKKITVNEKQFDDFESAKKYINELKQKEENEKLIKVCEELKKFTITKKKKRKDIDESIQTTLLLLDEYEKEYNISVKVGKLPVAQYLKDILKNKVEEKLLRSGYKQRFSFKAINGYLVVYDNSLSGEEKQNGIYIDYDGTALINFDR